MSMYNNPIFSLFRRGGTGRGEPAGETKFTFDVFGRGPTAGAAHHDHDEWLSKKLGEIMRGVGQRVGDCPRADVEMWCRARLRGYVFLGMAGNDGFFYTVSEQGPVLTTLTPRTTEWDGREWVASASYRVTIDPSGVAYAPYVAVY